MDSLIELIVNLLIALFSGNSAKPKPSNPSQPVPTPGRGKPDPAAQRRQALQQKANQLAQQKQAIAQRKLATMRRPVGKPPTLPPPIPRPAVAPMPRPAMKTTAAATSPAQTAQRPIAAEAIRQLVTSRPTALRTIYVLTEVMGPPLALRQTN